MSTKVFVESVDEEDQHEYGILAYQIISEFFLNDIQLSVIDKVRIIIDHEAPFFYIQIQLGKGAEPPKVIGDVAQVKKMDDGIHITIRNETYAPQLLRFLWAKIGRNNVNQLDRWESVVPHESMDISLLRNSVIFDPIKVTNDKISDFVYRIVPEGFRVQMNLSTPELIKFIFSENPIENEWLDKINKVLEHPPRPIPIELLEKLKKVPRYIHKLDEKMDRASYTRKILTPWKTYDFEEFSTKQRADKVKFLAGQMKGKKKKKIKKKGIKT